MRMEFKLYTMHNIYNPSNTQLPLINESDGFYRPFYASKGLFYDFIIFIYEIMVNDFNINKNNFPVNENILFWAKSTCLYKNH